MADLMQQTREQFEAWATSQHLPIKRHRWGEYKVEDTEAAWEAWQAALRAAPEWQPIETAPKDDTPVDLWRPSCGGERLANMRRIELSPGNVFYAAIESGYNCVRDATHWMPQPSPPVATRP